MLNFFRTYSKYILILLGLMIAVFIAINIFIQQFSKPFIYKDLKDVPQKFTVLVPGALVNTDGKPSEILSDRLEMALELYLEGKVYRFLLSGDHGTIGYDEVNHMKNYLTAKGVPPEDIFLDHAGFDTYNSIVRAQKIFKVDGVIIVTQQFHLSRALYIARAKHLDAYGYIADKHKYTAIRHLQIREKLACIKAFFEVYINRKPKFLGDEIPITGDSHKSFDQ